MAAFARYYLKELNSEKNSYIYNQEWKKILKLRNLLLEETIVSQPQLEKPNTKKAFEE